MKLIKKISITFLFIYFLWNITFVKAIDIPTGKSVVFYASKMYNDIYYNGEKLTIPIALSMYGSKQFPIYSLKKEGNCLNETIAYYTTVDETEKNERVRQILLQGYPNCTLEELGCSHENEAYLITQLAIWDIYYNYDLSKFTVTNQSRYPNIIPNLNTFIQKMRNLNVEEFTYKIDIDEKTAKWQNEGNAYNSKTYEILTNLDLNKYTVEILGVNEADEGKIEKIQIRNENNELQSKFSAGDKFKIFIPYNLSIEFEIIVKAETETHPIKKGEAFEEGWEPYVFLGTNEMLQTNLIQEHTYIEKSEEQLNPKDEVTQEEESSQESESKKENESNSEEGEEKEDKTEENVTTTINYSKKQNIEKLPQTGF